MISKSKYLISLFAFLFLLLLGIQVYFMYKTYLVKERDIYRTIHQGLTNYTDKLEEVSKVKDVSIEDDLQRIFIKYRDKKISKKEFLGYFEQNKRNTEPQISKYIDNHFKKEGYKIAAKIQYTSILSLPEKTPLIDKPVILYETKNKLKKTGIASSGKWETSSTSTTDGQFNKRDSFLVESITEFEILNIKTIVFKELILLFSCCFLLLASVLALFIFTVKNLIKQQKQVEVLHTVVDNISHEFKTPIATLKIAAKALKKDWNPETLPLIDRQISRLESLMQQLHKDEAGEILLIKPEDWDFFIQDLAFTYPEITFDSEIKVEKELPFDKSLLETIIKNLCENSVKYGASSVKINILDLHENLTIEISDNGEGIEKKELKNIFEKFYRIQSNNIHNTKGLGLGLYFVKKIIDQYRGKIEVISQPKEGTLFKINLPYEN
ncbi:HAMP domain-containing histidine kinase [Chryseobacterium sp. RG1]|uniref:histidine kinase n=1 Tax=Chryseobacterium tagetis TaxID=2801334 RepID=A0ABS7ZY41_9FLAO|nr:HAMP domain-containing sensor histidine kinase [Chryseobacterium tagetis]MCA6066643.1 HAMP domain-containing histidine kinase [Chryseobacterium tagetis]